MPDCTVYNRQNCYQEWNIKESREQGDCTGIVVKTPQLYSDVCLLQQFYALAVSFFFFSAQQKCLSHVPPNDQGVRVVATWVEAEGIGCVLLGEEKAQGDLVMVLQYKNGGYGKGVGSSLSTGMPCDRTRGDGHKLLQGRCLWMQGAFSMGDQTLE